MSYTHHQCSAGYHAAKSAANAAATEADRAYWQRQAKVWMTRWKKAADDLPGDLYDLATYRENRRG